MTKHNCISSMGSSVWRRVVSSNVLFLCAMLSLGTTAQAEHLNIYVLTGQSNSLGTTELEGDAYGPGQHPADNNTHFFWSNPSAIGSADPDKIVLLGDSGGMIQSLQMQQGRDVNPTFWGPEFGLARTLHDAAVPNVMVVKVSRGGGGNGYWRPEHGHMANHLLTQIDKSLAAAVTAGHTFQVRGFLYLQGESNSAVEADVADKRFLELRDAVIARINSAHTGAADDMHAVIAEVAASSTGSRVTTTKLQRSLAQTHPAISFVDTHDLPLKSDKLHFGRDSKLQIGQRFASALLQASADAE